MNSFGSLDGIVGAAQGLISTPGSSSKINTEIKVGNHNLTVNKELAAGGFGFVELLTESFTNKEFVLKRCNTTQQEGRDIAHMEINMLERFRHPNVVQIIAQDTSNPNEALILLEYCPNGHLLQKLNARGGNPLNLKGIISIFKQLLSAMLLFHSSPKPITHRDLKLENILLAADNTIRLCDFGSCVIGPVPIRTHTERTNEEERLSKTTTQMYRAPEMVDLYLRDELTEKTDIWALGCIFYSLIFLIHPFGDVGSLGILNGKVSYPLKILNMIESGALLQELTTQMLDVDPEARPTVSELLEAIESITSKNCLPDRQLTEEAKEWRARRLANQTRRLEQVKKKTVSTTPQIVSTPLNPNSVAAKRLAAKRGGMGMGMGSVSSTQRAVPPPPPPPPPPANENISSSISSSTSFIPSPAHTHTPDTGTGTDTGVSPNLIGTDFDSFDVRGSGSGSGRGSGIAHTEKKSQVTSFSFFDDNDNDNEEMSSVPVREGEGEGVSQRDMDATNHLSQSSGGMATSLTDSFASFDAFNEPLTQPSVSSFSGFEVPWNSSDVFGDSSSLPSTQFAPVATVSTQSSFDLFNDSQSLVTPSPTIQSTSDIFGSDNLQPTKLTTSNNSNKNDYNESILSSQMLSGLQLSQPVTPMLSGGMIAMNTAPDVCSMNGLRSMSSHMGGGIGMQGMTQNQVINQKPLQRQWSHGHYQPQTISDSSSNNRMMYSSPGLSSGGGGGGDQSGLWQGSRSASSTPAKPSNL